MAKNIRHWHGALAPLQELCLLQSGELANLCLREGKTDTEALTADRTLLAAFEEAENTPLCHHQRLQEKLAFCRALTKGQAPFTSETTESFVKTEKTILACLDTPFFAAFGEHFKSILPKAVLLPLSTFTEVGEAVTDGRADFGILPTENNKDGKLLHFYEQMERQELQIYATKTVSTAEGENGRFALVRKEPPPERGHGRQVLQCILFEENEYSLTDLLFAARASGFTLRRMDSLPVSYREDGFVRHPTFEAGEKADLPLFETFLALFMPRTVISAKYTHLT